MIRVPEPDGAWLAEEKVLLLGTLKWGLLGAAAGAFTGAGTRFFLRTLSASGAAVERLSPPWLKPYWLRPRGQGPRDRAGHHGRPQASREDGRRRRAGQARGDRHHQPLRRRGAALEGRSAGLFGLAFLVKILATSITVESGGSGGIVTSIFFIGTTAGAAFAAELGRRRNSTVGDRQLPPQPSGGGWTIRCDHLRCRDLS